MTKKSKKNPPEESKRFSNKKLFAVSIIAILIIVSGSLLSLWLMKVPEAKFPLRAIIIDQLGKDPQFLNASFVSSATSILRSSGFNVTYYNQTVDVNFYRSLAKSNYGIIILRAHTALRQTNDTVDIFTSERFVQGENRYLDLLDNQLVTVGQFLFKPGEYYYAITSKFIDNLEGSFPKSIVIAMGCWSLKPDLKPEPDRLAKAFIHKGASAYIGWTDEVYAKDTDAETVKLLNLLLVENRTISDAVSRTSSYQYPTIGIITKLRSYPSGANDLKVSTLINEAKAALTFQNSPTVATAFSGAEHGPGKRALLSYMRFS